MQEALAQSSVRANDDKHFSPVTYLQKSKQVSREML